VQPIELETDLDADIAGEAEDESPVAEADNDAGEEEDSEE